MPSLYVVPTPIGNLEDITLRALRILGEVQLILAEDTRHTRKLLTRYNIRTPLLSYHQHNKLIRMDRVFSALDEGDVALVSDSGMPSVSDPGFELIAAVNEAGMRVDVLPGPSAVVTAVVAAALPAPGFLFTGFVPRRGSDRRRRLEEIAAVPYAIVLYEAPHRLVATLRDILAVLGDRDIAVARELTKLHQEVTRGRVSEMLDRFSSVPPRGEITLVVGVPADSRADRSDEALTDIERRRREGEDRRTAVAAVVREYDVSRNDAYRLWVHASCDEGQPR